MLCFHSMWFKFLQLVSCLHLLLKKLLVGGICNHIISLAAIPSNVATSHASKLNYIGLDAEVCTVVQSQMYE